MAEDATFNIAVYARTDLGRVRSGNEDNFLVLNLSTADTWTPLTVKSEPPASLTTFSQNHFGVILAVTDGMGGALAGEVASRLAVECVRDRMLEIQASPTYSKLPFHERLRLSIEMANLYIHQMSLKRPECNGMGATFTAAGVVGATCYFAQVGDSRAYVIRQHRVQQITRDQSLVGHLVEAGHITEEEAERHTYKNVILQALGAAPALNVAVDRLSLRDMDIVVLCSDGLSNKVRASEMAELVDRAPSLKEACDSLVSLANERGGEDNITVMIAQFAGGGLQQPDELSSVGDTIPLAVNVNQSDRWGAVTIPRDPNLPDEVDPALLDDEEDTLAPSE
jgi:PPM family protein phosphatase